VTAWVFELVNRKLPRTQGREASGLTKAKCILANLRNDHNEMLGSAPLCLPALVIAQGASAMRAGIGIEIARVGIDDVLDFQKPAGSGHGWLATRQPRVPSLSWNVLVIALAWAAFAAILWHPAIHLVVLAGAFCIAAPTSVRTSIPTVELS
jgi:hypothetical protein